MKMDIVAGSGNDEFFTPNYAITPLIKYLKAKCFVSIWCPFDTEDSNFVKLLTKEGFNVVRTHLLDGKDFFETEVECDAIVSNPPYSIKGKVFERLFKLNIPFAMLVGVVGLFESEKRFQMFKDNEFEIMYLNRRVSYFKDYYDKKPLLNPPFSSVYVTSKILPRQIVFEEIVKGKIYL
tara:strand:- start:96 stop:632 length:537 start_codon:yes stop_codon:yes gene_type:complete